MRPTTAPPRKIKVHSAPHFNERKWHWWCECCNAGFWIYPEHWGDLDDRVPPGWATLVTVRNHLREKHARFTG
jgi:hypothetical protein